MMRALKPGQLCMFEPALARLCLVAGRVQRRLGTPIDVFGDPVDVRFDLPFVFLRKLDHAVELLDRGRWLQSYVVIYTHAGIAVEEARFVVPFDDGPEFEDVRALAAGRR